MTDPLLTRRLEASGPVDLGLSLVPLRMGQADPTTSRAEGASRHAVRTPEGAATLELRAGRSEVVARAWGEGAEWLLDRAAGIAGLRDEPQMFRPDGKLDALVRRYPGLRIGLAPSLFQMTLRYVLQQRVTWPEAVASWKGLVLEHRETAPGPFGLLLPPDPKALLTTSDATFMRYGVESRRADTIRDVARSERFLRRAPDRDTLARRLGTIPGIGPWTVGMVRGAALGDSDAVPIGDVNLPHSIAWALAGEPRGSDERMLELLAPYAGHRWRAIRLIMASGAHPPKPRIRTRRPR